MVENGSCLQIQTGVITPCRENPRYFKGGIKGACPFNSCVAAEVAQSPQLVERVVGPEFQFPINEQVLELVFHAVCPGLWNQNKDENAIMNYTVDEPFINV